MKSTILILLITLALLATACQVPDDVPAAEVNEPTDDDTSNGDTEEMEDKEEMNDGDMMDDDMKDGEEMDHDMDDMKDDEMMDDKEGMDDDMKDGEEMMDDEMSGTMINKETSSFKFEGYAPGKSHEGTFEEWTGEFDAEGDMIKGFSGVIQASSVKTDSSGLDAHLMKDDFFDVEVYPTIEFDSVSIEDGTATGNLNFHGVEKEISFPVEMVENGITADFLLDTEPFGMTNAGVDKQVRIMFEFYK